MSETAIAEVTRPIYSEFAEDAEYSELLEHFAKAAIEKRLLLSEVYSRQGWEEMRKIAHQLKGAGGGYGFRGLTVIAARLEECCTTADVAGIDKEYTRILDYLARVAA